MSDNIFSNFEPVDEQNAVSKDFENLKPFHASAYGPSRLFTAVYKGRKVIVKTLKPEFAQDDKCRENLKKEYEITSQLENKFIRKALAFESIQGLGECVIFEYIEGKSLAEHVRVGTLNEKQIKSILVDLCDGLNYMHQRGVIHCDLKPENILVTANDYRAKIIDIGSPDMEYKTDRELLIKENEFIAPELIKGEEGDPRSDVYSLGKITEFIIARNMLSQFSSMATHCTQFSREQRFDDVMEVKSVITKGYSFFKLFLLIIVLLALGVVAYIYVPKIIEKTRAEKAERLAVDFGHKLDTLNAGTNALCDKYKIASINDPISLPAEWKEDSIRFFQQLAPFMEVDSLKSKAFVAYENQKKAVIASRQHDFDALLITAFKQATDEAAIQITADNPDLSESEKARLWYNKTH